VGDALCLWQVAVWQSAPSETSWSSPYHLSPPIAIAFAFAFALHPITPSRPLPPPIPLPPQPPPKECHRLLRLALHRVRRRLLPSAVRRPLTPSVPTNPRPGLVAPHPSVTPFRPHLPHLSRHSRARLVLAVVVIASASSRRPRVVPVRTLSLFLSPPLSTVH
jgi:hypothetical protein